MKKRTKKANLELATKIACRADRFEARTLWTGRSLNGNRIGQALWRMAHKAAKRAGLDSASGLGLTTQQMELQLAASR